jgi:hypothetical protein
MASLVLGVVGAGLGTSLFGSGAVLGITGAQLGGALGAFLGSEIDAALAPGRHATRRGPRLGDTALQASTEGAAIPRLYGRVRVAGQLIWASQYKETPITTRTGSGKGFGPSVSQTDFAYSISFAVGLCAGATRIGRIWADGNLLDTTHLTLRFYSGSESQMPDPLIAGIEGADNVPAYRGLAYVVFEDLPLARFGNRIPQLQFEVIHALAADDPGSLENRLRGVALIPGAGEFVYHGAIVSSDDGEGATAPENLHNSAGIADIDASLDELQALAPQLEAVSLVVGWFGTDLRAGSCTIAPGVDSALKATTPEHWSVAGRGRGDAHIISAVDGRPAYGGTPSDASVSDAIRNLKSRGLRVLFYPFLFMDIASGNARPDPYTGVAPQPAYPWRGRITCAPAPGAPGSPDQTPVAATQVNAFFAAYRSMILHYAGLCAAAGGVDAFLIGSELRGLTRVRDGAASYPAVAALRALAADVRGVLGSGTKLSYAADWSEYNGHQTGAGALLFNLDPLWADPNIDFIGIDNYLPLADDRERTTYDRDVLATGIHGGEDFDWYYASDADRSAQLRTPIGDGFGKPWVWRAKDLWSWWSNLHYDRPSGTEVVLPTAWVPQSKPVWFTELGCPAIDKGANQPNVFFDPKSAESAVPWFSTGERDDLIQRRFLEAHHAFWSAPANNPSSPLYGGAMVDTANIYVWCWDARPHPFFPGRADVWGDAANWRRGHWLNGRLGTVGLRDLVAGIAGDVADATALDGLVTGFAINGTMSVRDALEPLSVAYHFDAVESEGLIRFVPRGRGDAVAIAETDLALTEDEPGFGFTLVRAQESDLPAASRIAYLDADADYRQASVESRRPAAQSERVATSSLPIVMDQGQATGIGDRLLQDAWVMRETAGFALPPSHLARDVGDEVALVVGGRSHRLRITQIDDAGARHIAAVTTDPAIYQPLTGPQREPNQMQRLAAPGRALLVFLDLPLLTGAEVPWAPHVAAHAVPWPGRELVFRSAGESNFTLDTLLTRPATLGRTTADFAAGALWRWDEANALCIRLAAGTLASQDDLAVLGGANAIAVENADGEWEIVQFATATLVAANEWRLTKLLRGQAGTEPAMRSPVAAGARVVLLDGAPLQLALTQGEAMLPFHYAWGPPDRPLSDASYQTAERRFAAIGLRPLAPVHLAARRSGGDILLAWIRRSRSGGDAWDPPDIPLGEESEAYDVDILDAGGAVKRVLATAAPAATYTAAMIAADFPGGLPSPLVFRVAQRSAAFGRGIAATASIEL